MAEKFRTSIGGQALIEGIMMRGPDKYSVAVRKPDGEIETKTTEYIPMKKKNRIFGIPIIRGVVNFGSSMSVGVKALLYSADVAMADIDEEPSKFDKWLEKKFNPKIVEKVLTGFALVLGIALPIGLFILLPSLLSSLFARWVGNRIILNLIEGALRIAIFVSYLAIVSRLKDMRRTFSYHGAEHKTIACYEAGDELTVENIRKHSRLHPRCGTSFLFVVMIISILIFSFISIQNPWLKMVLRLAMLPVVVAISYEFNMLVGRHDNFVTRFLRAPGMWLQNLTTNEPDDSMIEVAIVSVTEVLPDEEGADRW